MNYQPHKIMGWNVDQNPEIASPNQLSNEKNPGWLGYIGDEILPRYIGIIS